MGDARYKVWCKPGLTYYPVRKAASSSLQMAFGGEPVDMRRVPKGALSFTMVRNPFDRLASLYANNLDYPFGKPELYKEMSIQEYVDRVCAVFEPYCDQHFWSAAWTTPFTTKIYYFEDLLAEVERLNFEMGLNLELQHVGESKSPKPIFDHLQQVQIADRYSFDLKRFYENNSSPEGCRVHGKAEAKVRREAVERIKREYPIRRGDASTDSPSE